MKGAIQPNHMPVNKFNLIVVGLVPLTPTEISGIEQILQTVDMPDRTRASGGNTEPVDFTIMIPMHHTVEFAAMEGWYREGQDPVSPLYKKAATLIHRRLGTAGTPRTFQIFNAFVTGRTLPDLEMENEGELALIEYAMSADDIIPVL